MSKFIEALTRQLHRWQDETNWISYPDTKEMLTQAAAAILPDPLPAITLRREIDPDGLKIWTVLSIAGDDDISLDADDIATLRALLVTWDETRPAQIGDPLAMPCRLADGRVVSEVVEEILEDSADET